MKITPFFKWYDFWVGAYYDSKNKILYICPLPMVGIKIVIERSFPLIITKLFNITINRR
jgi:hypothetical protein